MLLNESQHLYNKICESVLLFKCLKMQHRRRSHLKVEGIIPAILTPLTKEQAFHSGAAEKLVNHLIDSGVHGILL